MALRKYATPEAAREARRRKQRTYTRRHRAKAAMVLPPIALDDVASAALVALRLSTGGTVSDVVRGALIYAYRGL